MKAYIDEPGAYFVGGVVGFCGILCGYVLAAHVFLGSLGGSNVLELMGVTQDTINPVGVLLTIFFGVGMNSFAAGLALGLAFSVPAAIWGYRQGKRLYYL